MTGWIKFGESKYTAEEMLTLDLTPPYTTFQKNTLSFCKEWLQVKNTFEIQTSGSTGYPKKIQLTRKQMVSSARMTAKALELKEGQTSLVCLDPLYIAGRMMLVRSLESNLNIYITEPSANPFEKISNDPIDFTALVPYQLKAILQSNQKKYFNEIRSIIIGGAPLDDEPKEQLQSFSCQFYETFGMTETISHIALKKLNGEQKSDYFIALPGISIRIDERNCLCIRTPYLPEEIITNDVVEFRDDNQFKWLGRFDNVINTGGAKVFPEIIERKTISILQKKKIINRFFICGLPSPTLGQTVTLIIEGDPFDQQLLSDLETEFKTSLSKFENPRAVNFIQQFVSTETGKINRIKTIKLLE